MAAGDTQTGHLTEKAHTNGQEKESKNGDGGRGELRKRKRHISEDSTVSVESMEDYIPTPPDGGWGWVIVFASMICNLIVDGIGYSFGVFLMEFVDVFQESKSKVSLVGSLLCGIYLFCGPIVSAMTNKFGCRPVIIAGSIVSTCAFVLATFSPSVDMLILTYGVMGGIGLGMMYLPSIVSVGYYFEKKRAFATGLAVCGSGIGTFMFPPLTEFLLNLYNWSGALLIIAGIIAQACICGVLMRPLVAKPVNKTKQPRAKNLLDRIKETAHRDRSVSESAQRHNSTGDTKIMERVMEAKLLREKKLQDNDSDLGSLPSIAFIKRGDSAGAGDLRRSSGGQQRPKLSIGSNAESSSSQEVPGSPVSAGMGSSGAQTPQIIVEMDGEVVESQTVTLDPQNETKVSAEMSESKDTVGSGLSDHSQSPVSAPETDHNSPTKPPGEGTVANGSVGQMFKVVDGKTDISKSNPKRSHSSQGQGGEFAPLLEVPSVTNGHVHSSTHLGSRSHLHSIRSLHVSKKDLARPLYRKDIFYSGSILNIPQFRSQPDMKSYIASITTIPGDLDYSDGPGFTARCINKYCTCLPLSARDILAEMVDLSLFTDLSFMMICLGNITAFLGFFVPFMFLVDRAVSLGVEKGQAALLISIIGITNTVGRVVIGKVADLKIVDSLVITYVSLATCGVSTALCPLLNSYALLATAAAIFGLGVAAFISLSSIIICDRMGLEKLTNAFGLLSMVRGISGMAGPPLAGFMFDSTKSYDLSFIIGGFLMLLGAGCHLFLHLSCLQNRRPQQQVIKDEEIGEEMNQTLGSKPQIITAQEVLSSA